MNKYNKTKEILNLSDVHPRDCMFILNYILDLEQENLKSKEQYCERTDCGGRLGNSKKVEELIKENKELKDELENKSQWLSYKAEQLDNLCNEIGNLKSENEKLNHYKLLYQKVKERNDKAIKVIDTQMKLAEDGAKENLRIIKFYLIKGECSVYDLTTEEDYKYKGNNEV